MKGKGLKKRGVLLPLLALLCLLWPAGALAAQAELEITASFKPDASKDGGHFSYIWTLQNTGPHTVQGIYVYVDEKPVRYIDALKSGESVRDEGVLLLTTAELDRRVRFKAAGYAQLTYKEEGSDEGEEQTAFVSASAAAMVAAPGEARQSSIPVRPGFLLPPEGALSSSVQLHAHAYLASKAVEAGGENTLHVFVHNDGDIPVEGLALQVGKETAQELSGLEPGESAWISHTMQVEKATSVSAILKYRNEKGQTKQLNLGSFMTYVLDPSLKITVRAEDSAPRPGKPVNLHIEITNTGEQAISGLALRDALQNPVALPATKLAAGESMRLRSPVSLACAQELVYCVYGKAKTDVAALSVPLKLAPAVPPETAGVKLRLTAHKSELEGRDADMVVFTCTLLNTGGYDLSAVKLMQDGKLLANENRLAVGDAKHYTFALKLEEATRIACSAEAMDEAGGLHSASAFVEIAEAADYTSNLGRAI